MNKSDDTRHIKPPPKVHVKVLRGEAREDEKSFDDTFIIGRIDDCSIQVTDTCVSRNHVKIVYDGEGWLVKDMESANGTYLDGVKIQNAPLPQKAELELGRGGPLFRLEVEREALPEITEKISVGSKGFTSETQILDHYFDKSKSGEAGDHTIMFRRAFERAHKKRSRKYIVAIVATLCLLLVSGGIIIYQKNKITKLKNTALDIFYAKKSLELQIAQMETLILSTADPEQIRNMMEKRKVLGQMDKDYDKFVKELDLYAKLSDEDRIIFRVARIFGECDINVPEDFSSEVMKYINKWKSTDRLAQAINRAKMNNYTLMIMRAMKENNLPPHFFYLALQESGFKERAVGPKTRYGYAKGIWQFIPGTAKQYGLEIGPLYKEKKYDPRDERFLFAKATDAAARYLKNINKTEAQASGLLVMASYNWGENNTRKLIKKMPENPRERNFWKLIATRRIPRETYDYVFYIFSAAVICENPGLFGFDFECPQLQ